LFDVLALPFIHERLLEAGLYTGWNGADVAVCRPDPMSMLQILVGKPEVAAKFLLESSGN
jgi:hypothetical protein